jgi:hypothetical protein
MSQRPWGGGGVLYVICAEKIKLFFNLISEEKALWSAGATTWRIYLPWRLFIAVHFQLFDLFHVSGRGGEAMPTFFLFLISFHLPGFTCIYALYTHFQKYCHSRHNPTMRFLMFIKFPCSK